MSIRLSLVRAIDQEDFVTGDIRTESLTLLDSGWVIVERRDDQPSMLLPPHRIIAAWLLQPGIDG